MKYLLPKTDLSYFDESVNSLIESHSKAQLRVEIYKAIAAEREACAKFCETNQVWVGRGKRGFTELGEDEFVNGGIHQGMDYAAAIRARGQA